MTYEASHPYIIYRTGYVYGWAKSLKGCDPLCG